MREAEVVEAGGLMDRRAYGMSARGEEEGCKVEGSPQWGKVQYFLQSQKHYSVGGFANLVVHWSHGAKKSGGWGKMGLC